MNILSLATSKQVLIHYLRDKINQEDWHAVADAAIDLREIEVCIKLLKEQNSPVIGLSNKPENTTGISDIYEPKGY